MTAPGFLRAKLLTEKGEFVAHVDILPFVTGYPEVLQWGARTFKMSTGGRLTSEPFYNEVFAYTVPAIPRQSEMRQTEEIPVKAVGDEEDKGD